MPINQNEIDVINALRNAIFAIEAELGITPSAAYSTVRSRIDILEAQINSINPINPENDIFGSLREAILAIEKELGITPSGVYSDVRARIDILEARINNLKSTILPDGYLVSPFYISNNFYNFTTSFSTGFHAPTEVRLEGSLYVDGYAPANLYIRQNNVWTRILSEDDAFTAGGDLTGDNHAQTVGQRKVFMFMGC